MSSGYSSQDDMLSSNKRPQDIHFNSSVEESMNKKAKLHDVPTISKTLHIRNLPSDVTEHEIVALALPFGKVVNVLLLKGKNQALLQMQDIQSTSALIHYFNTTGRAILRGRQIFFQYSNRDEITASQGPEQQNHILLVTVTNVLYPVDIDVLHRVFSKYGTILKIVIFNKSAGLQSLIQFADANCAIAAKMELDGQNIYSGCCTLRIQFSSLTNLNVKYNNEKSRDFTNPNLPSTPSATHILTESATPPAIYTGTWLNSTTPATLNAFAYPFTTTPVLGKAVSIGSVGLATSNFNSSVLIVSGLDPERITPDILFILFGVFGDVVRVKILHNKRDTALIQFVNPHQAETALTHLNGCPLQGNPLRVNVSKHSTISLPRPGTDQESSSLTKDFTGSHLHRYKVLGSRNFQHICPPSSMLHVSNLPDNISEEVVKELFNQSGTVVAFRFFPKDKKMALLQMQSLAEAVDALVNCHNYSINGVNIRVSFSKSSF